MKYQILITALILSVSLLSCKTSEDQIKNCFERYKSNILNKRGEDIVDLVDSISLSYYSNLLNTVLNIDSAELFEMNDFGEKIAILKIRNAIPKSEILKMNGEGLLVESVNYGITNNGGISDDTLGEIRINGDTAIAAVVSDKKLTPFIYHFLKKNGSWKIRMHTSSNIPFQNLFPDKSKTEREYILEILKGFSPQEPSETIWHPLK